QEPAQFVAVRVRVAPPPARMPPNPTRAGDPQGRPWRRWLDPSGYRCLYGIHHPPELEFGRPPRRQSTATLRLWKAPCPGIARRDWKPALRLLRVRRPI